MNTATRQDWTRHPIDGLTVLAFAYIALPNLIFLFGWLRWPVAMVLCAALLHLLFRALAVRPIAWRWKYSRAATLVLLTSAAVWAAFGGGSHFMYANPDWDVRDAVLGDLIFADWPVHYLSTDGARLVLRSAIGYFLPPATFGRIFGTEHVDIAIYLWTATGVLIFLALLPLPRHAGWRLALGLWLAVFFSGMDFVGQLIATESLPQFPLRLEWWVPLSYPSLTNQLLWAPNHSLPLWIGSLLVLRHLHSPDFLRMTAALLPLTLIWTPFAALGLAPFCLLGAVKAIRQSGWGCIPYDSVVSAAIFSAPLIMYLLLDAGQIHAGIATNVADGVPSYTLQAASLHSYLLFINCEFLFLALVLAPHVRQSRDIFGLALLILVSLPLLRFGPSNDVLLRLCAPPLIVLLVVCLQTLLDPGHQQTRSTLLLAWLFIAIGAHTAFNEFWRAATYTRAPADYRHTLAEKQDGRPAAHYAAQLGTAAARIWLKPLARPASDTQRNP